MPVEVRCPQCGSVLKAPDEAAGKKAKCKKCGTPFRVPGVKAPSPAPADDSVGDTLAALSVADSTALKTIDPAAIPTGDPFSFDAPAGPAVDDPTPVPAGRGRDKPRSKYSTRNLNQKAAPPAAGGAKKWLLIGGLAVACAGAGAAAAVFALGGPKTPTPAPAVAPADKPAEKPADDGKKEKAKSPGKAKEADKPTEKDPDRDAAAAVTIPAVAAPKAGKAAAAAPRTARGVTLTGGLAFPAAPKSAAVVQKSKARVGVEVDGARVRRVLTAGADAQVVGVVTPGFAGFQGKGAKDVLDRYSLASGKLIDRFEFDADGVGWPRAMDLSPNGEQLASEGPAGKLTVWDVGSKQKLLDGVDPHPELTGAKPGVAAVFFTDDGRLAVVGRHGGVDLWDVRGKAKMITGDPVVKGATRIDADAAAVTPDRKSVLVCADGEVSEIPLSTGKPKPGLTLPRKPGQCYALAADPSGSRVAVAYAATDPAPHTAVAVGRLGDPKDPTVFFIAPEAGRPLAAGWPAQETLVVAFAKQGAAAAFDLETNRLVGVMYPAGGIGPQVPGQANGLHAALVSTDIKDPKKSVFTVFSFPHDAYLGLRDEAGKAPVPLLITPDGLAK